MDRKTFLQTCGYTCLTVLGASILAEGCSPAKHIQAIPKDGNFVIPLSEFLQERKGKTTSRKYILVQSTALRYPIVIYKFANGEYSALLLECTHQGSELSVHGDLIACPAHGSEFNNRGMVEEGPAARNLKSFPVTSDGQNIYVRVV